MVTVYQRISKNLDANIQGYLGHALRVSMGYIRSLTHNANITNTFLTSHSIMDAQSNFLLSNHIFISTTKLLTPIRNSLYNRKEKKNVEVHDIWGCSIPKAEDLVIPFDKNTRPSQTFG